MKVGSIKAQEKSVEALSFLAYETLTEKQTLGAYIWKKFGFDCDIPSAIAQGGSIPTLISFLNSDNSVCQVHAAELICSLARNADNRVQLAKEGVILPLVSLLANENDCIQQNAAAALGNLARSNAENATAIHKAGAVPILLKLLSRGSKKIVEPVASALWNLTAQEDIRTVVVALGRDVLTKISNGTQDSERISLLRRIVDGSRFKSWD